MIYRIGRRTCEISCSGHIKNIFNIPLILSISWRIGIAFSVSNQSEMVLLFPNVTIIWHVYYFDLHHDSDSLQ